MKDLSRLKDGIPSSESLEGNAFNAVRLLCCAMVIAGHSLSISRTQSVFRPLIDMHIAVCAFFVLSGFWVTSSYMSCDSLKEFFCKRASRILPLYYLAVVGFAVVCVFYSELEPAQYFASAEFWKYLFWNAVFANFMHPQLPGVFGGGAINGSLWTIKIEIGFYIVLPLIILVLRSLPSRKRRNLFLALLYALSVLWQFLLSRYAARLGLPTQLEHQLPGFMSYFACGMLCYFNWDCLEKKFAALAAPAIIVFALHYVTRTEFLMPAALAVIVMWLGTRLRRLRRVGTPVDLTYGMYLFHYPLINMFCARHGFGSMGFFDVLAIFSISFLLAFAAEKYIMKKRC